MSQEKVTKYKEEKANRKSIMKKQKIARIVGKSIASVITIAAVVWVGYSGVTYIIENRPRVDVEVDYNAISEYETALSTAATETTDTETTDTEATDTESADDAADTATE